MPGAITILVAIALLFIVLAAVGYVRAGAFRPQHRTWLFVAALFLLVAAVVG